MNIQRAIRFLCPGVSYSFNGYEDYAHLIWPYNPSMPKPTLSDLQTADLPAAKAARISKAKGEASQRIYTSYPAYAQSNASLGLYNSLPNTDSFYPANIVAGIQAIITAEHTAETAINALTTSQAVDAFTW